MAVHLENIQPPIVVVVNKAATPFHVLGILLHASLERHFCKGSVALVAVEFDVSSEKLVLKISNQPSQS